MLTMAQYLYLMGFVRGRPLFRVGCQWRSGELGIDKNVTLDPMAQKPSCFSSIEVFLESEKNFKMEPTLKGSAHI